MRLGFHYHTPIMENDGQIYTAGYLGRFIDSLAEHCEEMVCFMHTPRATEVSIMGYAIQSDNVSWVDIGPHSSIPQRLMQSRKITKAVVEKQPDLDAILIRGPSPLLPAIANAVGDLPVALLLVGDYRNGIEGIAQPRWRREIIRIWSWWNAYQQLEIARHGLTFVNSRVLYQQLEDKVPKLHETRTTTLSRDDFYIREDTCKKEPYNLLYTGRFDRAKGLFEMVEAVSILTQQGKDVILDLVGWAVDGDTVLDELYALAQDKGITNRIKNHGFKTVGPELFEYYKQADMYLIASQGSEGFPRTIWEAMAHSLPVIATKVGSIPLFLENEKSAILIDPKSSEGLAEAILKVMSNTNLRQKLISEGHVLAVQNTLENRAFEVFSTLQSWLTGYE